MTLTKTIIPLLTSSMMTPAERAKGRFMRAPDGHGEGGGGKGFTQADLDKAVEAASAKFTDKIEELTNKYAGAMDDLKKAQRELRSAKDIKPEDLQAAEERADAAEARAKELEGSVKTLTKERDGAIKNLETEQGFTQKLLIQDGLKSALIANGVKDEDFIDSLAAKFSNGATVKIDGETRTALIGDKPLPDAIKEWAGTEAGKKFIAAPSNSGGGAGGSNGNGGSGKKMSESDFNALPPKARSAFMAEGGAVTEA